MGGGFLQEFDNKYEVHSKIINSFIHETKKCIQDIKITEILNEEKQNYEKELEKLNAENMKKPRFLKAFMIIILCERFIKLEIKCNADVLNLPDLEILKEEKHFTKIKSDLNKILDRVVRLSEMNPNEFDETKKVLSTIKRV